MAKVAIDRVAKGCRLVKHLNQENWLRHPAGFYSISSCPWAQLLQRLIRESGSRLRPPGDLRASSDWNLCVAGEENKYGTPTRGG